MKQTNCLDGCPWFGKDSKWCGGGYGFVEYPDLPCPLHEITVWPPTPGPAVPLAEPDPLRVLAVGMEELERALGRVVDRCCELAAEPCADCQCEGRR